MHTVDQYVLRVLADRWAAPSRAPSLLDVSRRGDGLGEELARVGFRITRLTLADSSLESVTERLAGIRRHFDAVVFRDVLHQLGDWREAIGRAARRLHPGGILAFGVTECRTCRAMGRFVPLWLRPRLRPVVPAGDLTAELHRRGLEQREMISLGAETLGARSTAYMGHATLRALRPTGIQAMRWDFTGTGERWIAGLL